MAENQAIVLPPDVWHDRQSSEGVVVNWFKTEGTSVKRDEPIAEVMIDKVTLEVTSPSDGILRRILVPQNGIVQSGTVLAEVGPAEEVATPAKAPVASVPAEAGGAKAQFVPATPAARRLARELGLDLARVAQALGPEARVMEEDVRAYQARPAADYQVHPLSPLRRVTAQRMRESLQRSAQLTIFREAEVSALVEAKARRALEIDVTYTDLIARALVLTLIRHPGLNAHLVEGELRQYRPIHLGVAVAVTDGLLVPVARNAQELTLGQLSGEIRRLVEAARGGQLKPDEASGSTFTLSNLGMYGAEFFTPVLNPPEVAILGVGRLLDRWIGTEVATLERRMFLPLSLTIDHQALDGTTSARFLTDLAEQLNRPDPIYG